MKTQTPKQDRFDVAQKCRAVLTIWTERQPASHLSQELGVSSSLLSQWQNQALQGMLAALEPRGTREAAEAPALPTQIRRLLERKVRTLDLQTAGRTVLKRRAEHVKLPADPVPATER